MNKGLCVNYAIATANKPEQCMSEEDNRGERSEIKERD